MVRDVAETLILMAAVSDVRGTDTGVRDSQLQSDSASLLPQITNRFSQPELLQ